MCDGVKVIVNLVTINSYNGAGTLTAVLYLINRKRTPRNNLIMFGVGAVTGAFMLVLMAYLMKSSSVPIAALYAVLSGLAFGAWLGRI